MSAPKRERLARTETTQRANETKTQYIQRLGTDPNHAAAAYDAALQEWIFPIFQQLHSRSPEDKELLATSIAEECQKVLPMFSDIFIRVIKHPAKEPPEFKLKQQEALAHCGSSYQVLFDRLLAVSESFQAKVQALSRIPFPHFTFSFFRCFCILILPMVRWQY